MRLNPRFFAIVRSSFDKLDTSRIEILLYISPPPYDIFFMSILYHDIKFMSIAFLNFDDIIFMSSQKGGKDNDK